MPSKRTAAVAASAALQTPVLGRDGLPEPKAAAAQPEMIGFHAKREEFDHEYDNDAELLVSELEFRPDDTLVSSLTCCVAGFVFISYT